MDYIVIVRDPCNNSVRSKEYATEQEADDCVLDLIGYGFDARSVLNGPR